MLNFIVLDFYDNEVNLYEEQSFIDQYHVEPINPKDYPDERERITDLVRGNGYDLAWSRQEAVELVIEKLELLNMNNDCEEEDEDLIEYAKMLLAIGESNEWDLLINHFLERLPKNDDEFDL